MATDLPERLEKIAQWVQQEDEALDYAPDAAEDDGYRCWRCRWCPWLARVATAGVVPAFGLLAIELLSPSPSWAHATHEFRHLVVSVMGLLALCYMILRETHE